jgi:predicted DCC family thiol-disulfide oxidoreductase YuxK
MFMAASITDSSMNGSGELTVDNTGAALSASSASKVVVDWDWKQLAADVFAEDERPIVLFDGVCNLCDAGINFAMDQDESAKFRFCSLHSKVAESLLLRSGKSPDDKSNIALITKDHSYFSSDAVSRICMGLDAAPLQWFGHLGQYTPAWVRESIFQFVSKNRYKFGENDSCRLDFDGTYTSRFISDPRYE